MVKLDFDSFYKEHVTHKSSTVYPGEEARAIFDAMLGEYENQEEIIDRLEDEILEKEKEESRMDKLLDEAHRKIDWLERTIENA